MIKNFDVLAGRLKGVKIGDKEITMDLLKEALSKDDQIEIIVPNVHILDDAALESMKSAIDLAGYNKGKDAGYEMFAKDVKQKAGIEIPGKTAEIVISELTKKIEKEKGVEPNKKISELSESLSNLQKQMLDKDNEITTWKSKHENLEKSTKVNKAIMSKVPKDLTGVNAEQFTTLLQTDGFSVEFDEGGAPVPTRHGKPLKDQYEKPRSVESVLLDYATQNKWLNGDGRGKGDETGGGKRFKTRDDVYAFMDKNKISPVSAEGEQLLKEFEAKA